MKEKNKVLIKRDAIRESFDYRKGSKETAKSSSLKALRREVR
jgi:hypothetical protein